MKKKLFARMNFFVPLHYKNIFSRGGIREIKAVYSHFNFVVVICFKKNLYF